jgi:hypothetical protein
MKFTDRFFTFLIKMYDGFSLRKAIEKEESDENIEGPIPADWVTGIARIPGKEIKKGRLGWHDGFSRERTVEQAANEGFDQTSVMSLNYGEFLCTWPRKKFEEKLNEFMEKFEAMDEGEDAVL